MKIITAIILFLLNTSALFSQAKDTIPPDGTYTYTIAHAEWGGKSMGATCTVVIKAGKIKVLHNGNEHMTGKKGDVIDSGTIMQHTKTGKWIVGKKPGDVNATEVGGCSSGPKVIDFSRKKFWMC